MKMKITFFVLLVSALTAVALQSAQSIGQSPNQSGPANTGNTPPSLPSQLGQYYSAASSYSLPPTNLGWASVGQNHQLAHSPHEMAFSSPPRKSVMLFIDKDGSIKRVEKDQGTPFSAEEIKAHHDARQELESALRSLKSPDMPDSKIRESKQLIAKYLKAEFQWDQQARREQLERLEKQVEQIKKQLAKREESQDKLIELRMQLLENDASGLSFPDTWSNINNALPGATPWTHNNTPVQSNYGAMTIPNANLSPSAPSSSPTQGK